MFGNLSGPTLLVILFIVLLLFGAPKLPALARSLGQSMRILKKEVSTDESKSGEESSARGSDNSSASTAKNDATTPDEAKNARGSDTPPGSSTS